MSRFLQSSNPALSDDVFAHTPAEYANAANVTTMQGVVNKTAILVTIAVATGALGYASLNVIGSMGIMVSAIAAAVLCIGFFFLMRGKPELARIFGPIYAAVEGFFLGGVTAYVDYILESKGFNIGGGAGLQAFIITICCVGSMLALYKAKILKPTRKFQAVVSTAMMAIMLAYLVSFVMSLVLGKGLPLISFGSAVADTGMMGFIGLGVNVVILLVASLFLIIDFGQVEEAVANLAPKYMEWYLGFGLLVTLAWIYFEALKLVLRLYVLFGDSD